MGEVTKSKMRAFSDGLYDFFISHPDNEDRNWRRTLRETKLELLQTAGIGVSLAIVGLVLMYRGADLYAWAISYFGARITLLAVAFFVIGAGFLADWYKQKNPFRYGNIEVLVGIFSAFAIALNMDSEWDLAKWASLFGAGYVIARGQGNKREARKPARTASPPALEVPVMAETPLATPDA